MKTVILAAGIGSRLGNPYPKPLTTLNTGETIMQRQIEALQKYVSLDDIIIVVGFKKEMIMESFPSLTFVYNAYFDATNTSKSLLCALRKLRGHDVLWLNGDVVFDPGIIERLITHQGSCMAVNTASVADEEVKYVVSTDGSISQVSKEVVDGLGEAVGINMISKTGIPMLVECLEACSDNDYFERGIEMAIDQGLKVWPVDVSDAMCTEVDFVEDLARANEQLGTNA